MSDPYTRFYRSIWHGDFTDLSQSAQRCYFMLGTQQDISHAGILPVTVGRWSRLATDTDADSVRADLAELDAKNYVRIDAETEELWVRSYIRYDGQYKNPNGLKAVNSARDRITSKPLRQYVSDAVSDLLKALPEGATQGATEAPSQGDTSPKQQAASKQQPASTAGSKQPAPLTDAPGRPNDPEGNARVAAAAIEILIAYRIMTSAEPVRNPTKFGASIRESEQAQNWPRLMAGAAEGGDAKSLAVTVLGVPLFSVNTAAHKAAA